MNKEIIVTVVGKNRAGVLSELTSVVARLNGNIMDLSQKIAKGNYFNLIMIIDTSKSRASFKTFKERLEFLGETKGYKVIVQHQKIFQAIHRV